jgi:hypothetical protein
LYLNWLSLIRKLRLTLIHQIGSRPCVRKEGFGFLQRLVDTLLTSDTGGVDASFWSDVIGVACRQLDAFDGELREAAGKLLAAVPPLSAELVKVLGFNVFFKNNAMGIFLHR